MRLEPLPPTSDKARRIVTAGFRMVAAANLIGPALKCLAVMMVVSGLTACESTRGLLEELQPPKIAADPLTFMSTTPDKRLSAVFTPPGGAIEVVRIEVVLNRDTVPDTFDSKVGTRLTVSTIPSFESRVAVTIPPTVTFAPAQLVTVQWFIDYRLREGTEIATVQSGRRTTRLDCTDQQVTAFLRSLQAIVTNPANFPQILIGPADITRLAGLGYVPTHGFRSFIGQGVAFAAFDPAQLSGLTPFSPTRPSLLLYRPTSAGPPAVNEPNIPDFPYALSGFAFAKLYDPARRPTLGCMPHEAWFVHEAGFHSPDGTFAPDPPRGEAALGDLNPFSPNRPPPITAPGIGATPPWHPRLWDVHLWINPAPGAPFVSPCNVGALGVGFAPNLATCGPGFAAVRVPPTGSVFPTEGFFVRPPLP